MNDSEAWEQFLELCLKIKTKEQYNEFFDLFLTIEEKNTLSSRYKIIKSLFENSMPQRKIAAENQVSVAQITRGSNALKRISKNIEDFLKKNLQY